MEFIYDCLVVARTYYGAFYLKPVIQSVLSVPTVPIFVSGEIKWLLCFALYVFYWKVLLCSYHLTTGAQALYYDNQ